MAVQDLFYYSMVVESALSALMLLVLIGWFIRKKCLKGRK